MESVAPSRRRPVLHTKTQVTKATATPPDTPGPLGVLTGAGGQTWTAMTTPAAPIATGFNAAPIITAHDPSGTQIAQSA